MSKKLKAEIIGASGNQSLAVKWLKDSAPAGLLNVGGPAINELPLSLVPRMHRMPNSIVLVSFSNRHTVTKVEAYESNT